jgi:linoleoyl-CoA desaturase
VKFFKKKIGNYDNKKHPNIEYFNLFFFKLLYYTIFLVLPMIFINALWWQVLLGFLVLHYCEGITLADIFMLAHEVEEAHFPLPDERGNIQNSGQFISCILLQILEDKIIYSVSFVGA